MTENPHRWILVRDKPNVFVEQTPPLASVVHEPTRVGDELPIEEAIPYHLDSSHKPRSLQLLTNESTT